MTESATVRRLRRSYASKGIQVRKISERSRWFSQYGPYMLVDAATRAVVALGLTEDRLEGTS